MARDIQSRTSFSALHVGSRGERSRGLHGEAVKANGGKEKRKKPSDKRVCVRCWNPDTFRVYQAECSECARPRSFFHERAQTFQTKTNRPDKLFGTLFSLPPFPLLRILSIHGQIGNRSEVKFEPPGYRIYLA